MSRRERAGGESRTVAAASGTGVWSHGSGGIRWNSRTRRMQILIAVWVLVYTFEVIGIAAFAGAIVRGRSWFTLQPGV